MKVKLIKEGIKDLLSPERVVNRELRRAIQFFKALQNKMALREGLDRGKFFAVTTTSLYEVMARAENGRPYIRKIDLRGESQIQISETMSGDLLAVAKWLQFFIPEGHGLLSPMTSVQRKVEMVNTVYWQGKTSDIIALFLTEEKARECFASPDLKPCDTRWLENTKEVLEAIRENHPTITICHWRDMALIPE